MLYKHILIAALFFFLNGYLYAESDNSRYTGELHPPVRISDKGAEIVVLFTKNNMKRSISSSHIANGEIFYISTHPFLARLNYVSKIEDDEVVSVFFHDWENSARGGRSLYILTKRVVSNDAFSGHAFSTAELPLIHENNILSLNFFPGDLQDSTLINCYDGRDLIKNKQKTCPYKDAYSIKKYLSSLDQ
jgi:hypothetical protein